MPQPTGSKSPATGRMSPAEAGEYFGKRTPEAYTLLDVRQDWEYEEMHLPGARLLPLGDLADSLAAIPKDKPVLTYCRSGKRSAAAASLLAGQGFAPVIDIEGGIDAWNGLVATGGLESGMIAFPESPSPAEVLALAYAMEDMLAVAYRRLAEQVPDLDVSGTLNTLAGFEDKHKTLIAILFSKLGPGNDNVASLAGKYPPVMESGRSLEDYLNEATADLSQPRDVLELALQIEAQALDLYMRYANRTDPGETRETYLRLAREEKGHLKALGNLMARQGK